MHGNLRRRARFGAAPRGISMIEALVALVVIAVGMLGIAGLFVASVKTNRTALLRSQAVAVVNDMADRIQANRQGRNAYALAQGTDPAAEEGCASDSSSTGNNCTAAELARDDVARWVTAVRNRFPRSGTANAPAWTRIDVTQALAIDQPDTYTIAIGWREPGEPADFSYQISFQLIPGRPI